MSCALQILVVTLPKYLPLLLTANLIFPDETIADTDLRIINGHVAKVAELPYQVSLRRSFDDDHFCGGSLISDWHVLTAAHCMFYGPDLQVTPEITSVFIGQSTLKPTSKTIYRNASDIFVHPDFNHDTMTNDLAIVELDKKIPENNKSIRKIPLNNRTDYVNWNCIVSGWGVHKFDSEVLSDRLEATDVAILNRTFCQKKFDILNVTIYDGMLCAANYQRTTDACQGDSGGPLACHGMLAGVISTGKRCADRRFPGIYTDVRFFLSWIENITDSYRQSNESNVTYAGTSSTTTVSSAIYGDTQNTTSSSAAYNGTQTPTTDSGAIYDKTQSTTVSSAIFQKTQSSTASSAVYGGIQNTTSSSALYNATQTPTADSGAIYDKTQTTTASSASYDKTESTTVSSGIFQKTESTTASSAIYGGSQNTTSVNTTETTTASSGTYANFSTLPGAIYGGIAAVAVNHSTETNQNVTMQENRPNSTEAKGKTTFSYEFTNGTQIYIITIINNSARNLKMPYFPNFFMCILAYFLQ